MHLRPILFKHLDRLREWRNDDSIRCWCRQVGYISEQAQIKWYNKQESDPTIQMFCMWDNTKLVGVCGLTDIDLIHSRAEFSLYVGPEFQRRGYAREALSLLFKYGFNELNLNLIWGETFEGNPAFSLFTNTGMTLDGTRREHYYKDGTYIDAHIISIRRSEFA